MMRDDDFAAAVLRLDLIGDENLRAWEYVRDDDDDVRTACWRHGADLDVVQALRGKVMHRHSVLERVYVTDGHRGGRVPVGDPRSMAALALRRAVDRMAR